MTTVTSTKRPQGFAAINPERQREIARLGGAAQPRRCKSFVVDPELAQRAGRLGGLAWQEKRRQSKQGA